MSVLHLRPSPRAAQLPKARLWGDFGLDYTISQDGDVSVQHAWRKKSLVTLHLPEACGIERGMAIHRAAAPVFQAWLQSWSEKDAWEVVTLNGSFVPRLMRGTSGLPSTQNPTRDWNRYLSRHSRGIAIDLNARWNRRGTQGAQDGEIGCLWRVIDLARLVRVPMLSPSGERWEAGIVCGVDWRGKYIDPMHFEIGIWR